MNTSGKIIISLGDPAGIGPEVTLKALRTLIGRKRLSPHDDSVVILGSLGKIKIPADLKKWDWIAPPPKLEHGGAVSFWAFQSALQFAAQNPAGAVVVTGPISKERWAQAGHAYQGHTDFLGKFFALKQPPTMMLANTTFRVALTTDHIPLKDVSRKLTSSLLTKTITDVADYVAQERKGKRGPLRIAVLGLNPHAGEAGLLGSEEQKVILPVIEALNQKFNQKNLPVLLEGPISADSFFALEKKRPKTQRFSAIIAHYHDQGLIPLKLAGFSRSINITLGLPIKRVSVDHGTGFGIAGQNKADPGSMIEALLWAKAQFKR